jgi:hypothetical protein
MPERDDGVNNEAAGEGGGDPPGRVPAGDVPWQGPDESLE